MASESTGTSTNDAPTGAGGPTGAGSPTGAGGQTGAGAAPGTGGTPGTGGAPSGRAAAKAARREQLLTVAKALFARHGFHGVRLEDLANGAGISTPAVYRHFQSKEAVLEELLVRISEYLHSGGREVITGAAAPASAAEVLVRLIDFHIDFAMSEPELIRIQDRDFAALPEQSRRTIRRLQRAYVSDWARVVEDVHPDWGPEGATIRVHAVFGMMNSTPHLARGLSPENVSRQLRTAARAALELGR